MMKNNNPKSVTEPDNPKSSQNTPNPTLTVNGYVTDPKRVGFQILTNYENIYWARLVNNNDAWRLYEVLRGFCHEQNNVCYPSINYLTEILGLKERRVLTGWQKKVKDKIYSYQGLIDILQQFNLVIAEVEGSGKESRYIFHVTLTPELLTQAQVSQLPILLQRKHAELLDKVEQAKNELLAKKRPPKYVEPQPEAAITAEIEGIGKLPMGIGNLPKGIGKLPETHLYNINNTNLTTPTITTTGESIEQGTNPKAVVVASLIEFGVSKKIANNLATQAETWYLQQKLDYAQYLLANAPDKIKKPSGWLVKAIEQDYAAPDGFMAQDDLAAQAEQAELEAQRQDALEQRAAKKQQKIAQLEKEKYQQWRAALSQTYGTTKNDFALWKLALDTLKTAFVGNEGTYKDVVAKAEILRVDDQKIWLGVATQFALDRMRHRNYIIFEREFNYILQKPMKVEFIVVGTPDAGAEVGSAERADQVNGRH